MAQHPFHAKYSIDSKRRYAKGSSLLEVLVSILIVSLGLAAMMGMQMFSQAANKNAVNRGAAITLANELADMIRANPGGFANRSYDLGSTPYFDGATYSPTVATAACTYPCGASPITAANIATAAVNVAADDLNYFRQHVRSSLPAGGFHVQTLGTAPALAEQADIWIIWNEAAVLNSSVTTTSAAGVATTASSESNIDDCPAGVTNARCIRFRVNP